MCKSYSMLNVKIYLCWLIGFVLFNSTLAHAAIFIEDGILIDGTKHGPKPNPGILIVDDIILTVGKVSREVIEQAERVSARGKWVLPGLFDLHVHITFKLPGPRRLEDDVINAIRAERFLEQYQKIGVTTVRDVGARGNVGYSLKRAQRQGLLGGARFFTSGPIITATGGHATEFQPLHAPIWAVEANGPWEFRQRVRQAIKLGADLIKVTPRLTQEEFNAVVDEAHAWHKRVTAQIGGTNDLDISFGRMAVEAGVDSAEHFYPYGGREVIKAMVEQNIYVIPTLAYQLREIEEQYAGNAEKQSGRWLETHLGHSYSGMMIQFADMQKAGIKFAVGTDSNVKDLKEIRNLYQDELKLLSSAGLSNMELIQAATLIAAEAMGLDKNLGSITPGKWADIIILGSDPGDDIKSLVNPELVIQNGEVVYSSELD